MYSTTAQNPWALHSPLPAGRAGARSASAHGHTHRGVRHSDGARQCLPGEAELGVAEPQAQELDEPQALAGDGQAEVRRLAAAVHQAC